MRISLVCSDRFHPVFPYIERWCADRRGEHQVDLVSDVADLVGGDLLLLISCGQIVRADTRTKYRATLVIHASDLPAGRGWSPLVWQILEGKNDIAVSLLEAADPVDTGAVWAKRWLHFNGTELYDEIHTALFIAELELMDFAVDHLDNIQPVPQCDTGVSVYRLRTPGDSRIDPMQSLADQFDLLRVADPARYPAFFDFRGECYEIVIRKKNNG